MDNNEKGRPVMMITTVELGGQLISGESNLYYALPFVQIHAVALAQRNHCVLNYGEGRTADGLGPTQLTPRPNPRPHGDARAAPLLSHGAKLFGFSEGCSTWSLCLLDLPLPIGSTLTNLGEEGLGSSGENSIT